MNNWSQVGPVPATCIRKIGLNHLNFYPDVRIAAAPEAFFVMFIYKLMAVPCFALLSSDSKLEQARTGPLSMMHALR